VRAVVETAGFALNDEKPKRISRFFDETVADFSFRSGRWACGKCRQRSLKPPPKPPERLRSLLGNFIFEGCPSRTKRIQCHRRAPKYGLSATAYLFVSNGLFKLKPSRQCPRFFATTFDLAVTFDGEDRLDRRRRSPCPRIAVAEPWRHHVASSRIPVVAPRLSTSPLGPQTENRTRSVSLLNRRSEEVAKMVPYLISGRTSFKLTTAPDTCA